MLRLRTAIGSYPHTQALKNNPVLSDGVELEHVAITPISDAFKPMCRNLEFDVAEMSITGYLLGRVYEKGFTALPVFPVRAFGSGHASIRYNAERGEIGPRDLGGGVVGARAYTGAASFWTRGVLMHEYGVDASAVTWLSSDEEHVLEYQQNAPANARYKLGADLNGMLLRGELKAGIGLSSAGPSIKPLIPDARRAAIEHYQRTGIYQINHTIVLKDALLAEHPWLAEALYEAFLSSKLDWLAGSPDLSLAQEIGLENGDPYPYGLAANHVSLQALMHYAEEQKIVPRTYAIEEIFPIGFD
jgi:4,5-dihydroxyphthalate decarboxylase